MHIHMWSERRTCIREKKGEASEINGRRGKKEKPILNDVCYLYYKREGGVCPPVWRFQMMVLKKPNNLKPAPAKLQQLT